MNLQESVESVEMFALWPSGLSCELREAKLLVHRPMLCCVQHRQTDRQTNRQTDRQTNRQTDRQTLEVPGQLLWLTTHLLLAGAGSQATHAKPLNDCMASSQSGLV